MKRFKIEIGNRGQFWGIDLEFCITELAKIKEVKGWEGTHEEILQEIRDNIESNWFSMNECIGHLPWSEVQPHAIKLESKEEDMEKAWQEALGYLCDEIIEA